MDSSPPAAGRTRVACEHCRKNNRKCDGDRPACGLCAKVPGRTCEYAPEPSRKRRYDEDLITTLQDQVAALEGELSKYQSTEKRMGSLERSGPRSPAQIPFQQVEIDPFTSTPYVIFVESSELLVEDEQVPTTDVRSQIAMEELASLMLTMDVEEQGEPSFTITSGKAKSPKTTNGELNNAESMLLDCLKHWSSDLVVQGIALLAWRELMLGNDSMAYNYIGMATGALLILGLHASAFKESSAVGAMPQDSHTRKIRSFWAYFSVDKLLTSSLGMNCTIHWQRIRCQPYLSAISRTSTIDDISHNQFCQLWHLWDSCMDQVHAFAWSQMSSDERRSFLTRSHQALEKFYSSTDERLRLLTAHSHRSVTWFQLSYHAALILIHRPFLNVMAGSFALKFSMRSATSAAASISRIIRLFRKDNELLGLSPQIVDYLLSASVIHLLNATSGRTTTLGRKSANGLRICLEALLAMDEKWHLRVQRAVKRIQELAHRWIVVWSLPLSLSQPLPEQELKTPFQNQQSQSRTDGSDSFDTVNPSLWDPGQYTGALDQINTGWSAAEEWNLDLLFGMPDPGIDFSW